MQETESILKPKIVASEPKSPNSSMLLKNGPRLSISRINEEVEIDEEMERF